jgi:hypothetical protein
MTGLMTRGGPALRVVGGLLVLGVLVWRLGTGPFVDGLRATGPWTILLALVVTAATTWCCAARWSLVSGRLGAPVRVRTAYVAYYRSQLVNATLPGGVVGDVHRGLRHGLRSVVWERGLGQVVQVALTVVLLLVLPSPFRWVGLAALAVLGVAGLALQAVRAELRRLGSVATPLVLLSAGAVLGHLLIFTVAARAAGASLRLPTLVALGVLVLLASAIPVGVAGWGPREGVAAWAFAAAGSSAAVGLTVAVTFGVLAMVATLPGLLVLGSARHG